VSRVVLVHGFTQTGASWSGVAEALRADGHEVLSPDLGTGPDLWAVAGELGEAGGEATYVGYSMGGRVALHLALARPELVRALVLLGATGGIDDDAERAERRAADEALARSIEADGADAFLERWLAQPMFAAVPPERPDARCRDAAALATSLRSLGTGTQEPLWERLASVVVPVLVLAGERDAKFRALGERLIASLPRAELATVAGAGHAAHLERPEAFLEVLRPWLASH
jgi:2-succinyl-6-hydroxy-2,4-cyclohexadiene-1-carboxylate synthase